MCLTNTPQYGQLTSGEQSGSYSSLIYRTEYETSAANLNTAWNNLQNYEAPCVVCQAAAGRLESFVQPGRATCPTGFNTEFQ